MLLMLTAMIMRKGAVKLQSRTFEKTKKLC